MLGPSRRIGHTAARQSWKTATHALRPGPVDNSPPSSGLDVHSTLHSKSCNTHEIPIRAHRKNGEESLPALWSDTFPVKQTLHGCRAASGCGSPQPGVDRCSSSSADSHLGTEHPRGAVHRAPVLCASSLRLRASQRHFGTQPPWTAPIRSGLRVDPFGLQDPRGVCHPSSHPHGKNGNCVFGIDILSGAPIVRIAARLNVIFNHG